MAIEIIRLNLIPEGNPPVVHCKQYDNGRVFQIVLYNGKDPYILTTETIELNIRKSDRHIVTADLPFVVGEHCVDVTTTEQMCAVAGKNTAEIRIIRDGINIGTLNFFMQIERSPMENGLESDSEINNLARQVHDNVVQELADHGAKDTGYDNTESGLEATNVQDAIDEVNEKIENIPIVDAYTKEETDNKFATKESLETLSGVVDGKANATDVTNALANKLDKANPTGTGSLSLNRKAGSTVGSNSVAMGTNTRATGTNTTALGNDTLAYGENSVAMGSGSSVSGTNSVAIGNHTKANSNTQFVFGKYNKDDNNNAYAEIVGNGTTTFTKSNARTLDWQGNETLAGDLTYNGNKSLTSEISRLDIRIDNLPAPMIFKGTLGVGGTIQTLPTASASNEGFTYKVITDGTYAGQTAKDGDVFTSNGSAWVYIPSGDEDNDTWRAIKVNGVEKLGNGISSGSLDVVDTDNIEAEFDNDGNKLKIKTKNIYTQAQVDAIVSDAIYNVLPDDTASGSVANFNTDLALPVKSLEIDVNAKQDLHGYDYPWTAGGGKNVIDTRNIDTTTAGIHVTSDADGVISMSGTRDTSAGWKTFVVFSDFPTGDYVFSTNNPHVTCLLNYTQKTSKFTVNTGDVVRLALNLSSGDIVSDTNIKVQIEKGSTATEWTPYENVCPITGHTEAKITHTGKNLTNIAELPWTVHWGTDAANLVQFLNTLPVGRYTISNKYKINEVPSSGKVSHGAFFIRALVNGTVVNVTPYTIVTDSNPFVGKMYQESVSFEITDEVKGKINHAYRYCDQDNPHSGSGRGSYDCYDIQVEVGSTVTDYEPYGGNEYIINLGGTYYGGHFTQDKAGHRQFEVTSKFATFTGANNESWNDYPAGNGFFINLINDHITESYGDGKCNILPTSKTFSNLGIVFGINSSYIFLMQVKSSWNISTVNELRDFLSVNNLQVVYTLAEPIIIDLPDGEPITTLIGTNNIYADTGDTSVVFKDSVNGYVEKKIASVQALALNT